MSKKSPFINLGASIITNKSRDIYDAYFTNPNAVEDLLNLYQFNKNIWEPACGTGNISETLKLHDYNVISSDIVDYGYKDTILYDFLHGEIYGNTTLNDLHLSDKFDIITNPPYRYSLQFAQTAMKFLSNGCNLAMLLKLQWLETKKRYKFIKDNPIKYVYVYVNRIGCSRTNDFVNDEPKAICYAWYIWEKGYKGDTILRHIDN